MRLGVTTNTAPIRFAACSTQIKSRRGAIIQPDLVQGDLKVTNLITTQRTTRLSSASREAEGYLELGMHGHALRVLQRRGKLVHADPWACFLMGESLRELSRCREALYPLRRSAVLEPSRSETWLAIGWCYKRTGQIQEAIVALERAIALSPGEAILHYNLACYYSLANRRLAAIRRLRRAIDLDANFSQLVPHESDFDCMRSDPSFRMLVQTTS